MQKDSKIFELKAYRMGDSVFHWSSRTYLMGILNVTPDSFSDGGRYLDADRAVEFGLKMIEEGADIIDVGGESTKPGSDAVLIEEELGRVLPVFEGLSTHTKIPLSIDTYKSPVADAALGAGARIVNDISGLTMDSAMAGVVARHQATVVLMHMKGTPKTMQLKPAYTNVVEEVKQYLKTRSDKAREAGIDQIILDPGIGFGKTLEHNLQLIAHLDAFADLGFPVLVGPSRKSFIGMLLDLPVTERLEGTSAAVTASILRGANIIRVHDVKEMKRVAAVADAIRQSALRSIVSV